MAQGIIEVIPSGTHVQVLLQGGGVTYPSARVLNPNDGILYVAENRDCLGTGVGAWDWKIPSQSFAVLPGGVSPGMQTLGLYYLDQSGANASGDITVYPSLTDATDPVFVAIGRANLVYQNVLDITQGTQPANPAIGQSRLWVDSSSVLHVLDPSGNDHVELDSTNYLTYVGSAIDNRALGGDLYGTVANGHVRVQNASAIYSYNASNVQRFVYQPTGDNYNAFFCSDNGFLFVNYANTERLGYMDNSGNFVLSYGNLSVAGSSTISGAEHVVGSVQVDGNETINGVLEVVGANYTSGWIYCANYPTLSWNGATACIYNGLSLINGSLLINGNAPNSPGAYIALTQRIGTQICLYDAGGTNCFGLGINSSELTLITPGVIGFRFNNNSGTRGVYIDPNAGNVYSSNLYASGSCFVGAGYGLRFDQSGTPNNYIYSDNANLQQYGTSGSIFRFVGYQYGTRYWDMTLTNDNYVHMGGTNPYLVATQFVITSSSYSYTAIGRSGNELACAVHCYVPGNLYAGGTITPGSARRFKTDIATLADSECLARVVDPRVPIVTYHKDAYAIYDEGMAQVTPDADAPSKRLSREAIDGGYHDHPYTEIGIIAEDAQHVVPELVVSVADTGDVWGLNYAQLTAVLWGAVRALNERMDRAGIAA